MLLVVFDEKMDFGYKRRTCIGSYKSIQSCFCEPKEQKLRKYPVQYEPWLMKSSYLIRRLLLSLRSFVITIGFKTERLPLIWAAFSYALIKF